MGMATPFSGYESLFYRMSPQFQEAYQEGFEACKYQMIQMLEAQLKWVKAQEPFTNTTTTVASEDCLLDDGSEGK